jgi:PRTRC genetic system protein E
MLFNKLLPLLADVTLSFTVSAKDDKISVTVVPKSTKDSKKAISNTPLAISGTADEMDEQFVDEIEKALGKVVGFMSNADEFVESVKEEANAEASIP